MSETKFTPGPWAPEGPNVYVSNYELASCHDRCEQGDPRRAEANARLIAAAPDLYITLDVLNRNGGLGSKIHEEIERVLAQARGES